MNLKDGTTESTLWLLHRSGGLRRLHERVLPGSVSILMYHGLTRVPLTVPDPCFVSRELFERQIAYIARNFEVLHVEEALSFQHRASTRPVACITFDDGFASLHDLALPILEAYRTPATVYLVTDLIDTDQTVWFAALHQAIMETTTAKIEVAGREILLHSPEDRQSASQYLQVWLKSHDRPAFEPALNGLLAQLGFASQRPSPIEPFKMLNTQQIQRMCRNDLIRFGAHTTSHQILTRTTKEDATREIRESIAVVAKMVERPSLTFAYPNGAIDDFDVACIEALRGEGITIGLTSSPGPALAGCDPFTVPRYIIPDCSLPRFAARVHHARFGASRISGLFRRESTA